MPFEHLATTAFSSLSHAVGEDFVLKKVEDEDFSYGIRGLWDNPPFEDTTTVVEVRFQKPSVQVKDGDVLVASGEDLLPWKKYIFERSDGEKYYVTDYQRDDVATTRYYLEKVE